MSIKKDLTDYFNFKDKSKLNIAVKKTQDKRSINLNAPFIKQESNKSSETSAAMMLQFLRHKISPGEIKCDSFETMIPCLDPYLKCQVLSATNLGDIKRQLMSGLPVMVKVLPKGSTQHHTVLVTGFDGTSLKINDPKIGRITMSFNKFRSIWKPNNNQFISCEKPKRVQKRLETLTQEEMQEYADSLYTSKYYLYRVKTLDHYEQFIEHNKEKINAHQEWQKEINEKHEKIVTYESLMEDLQYLRENLEDSVKWYQERILSLPKNDRIPMKVEEIIAEFEKNNRGETTFTKYTRESSAAWFVECPPPPIELLRKVKEKSSSSTDMIYDIEYVKWKMENCTGFWQQAAKRYYEDYLKTQEGYRVGGAKFMMANPSFYVEDEEKINRVLKFIEENPDLFTQDKLFCDEFNKIFMEKNIEKRKEAIKRMDTARRLSYNFDKTLIDYMKSRNIPDIIKEFKYPDCAMHSALRMGLEIYDAGISNEDLEKLTSPES